MQVFNLNSPQTVYKELDSPLKYQTRCVTCFPDATGYLVSSSTHAALLISASLQTHTRSCQCPAVSSHIHS